MSLPFLSDQCVPDEIGRILTQNGYKVTSLREVLPVRSPDSEVIAKAQALDLVLLSLNGDFADIFDYPPSAYGGIVAVQLKNHPEAIPPLMATADVSSDKPQSRVLSRQTVHCGAASYFNS
jgi:hypothetical protein